MLQQVLWKLNSSFSYYLPIQDEPPSQSVRCVLKRNSRRSQVHYCACTCTVDIILCPCSVLGKRPWAFNLYVHVTHDFAPHECVHVHWSLETLCMGAYPGVGACYTCIWACTCTCTCRSSSAWHYCNVKCMHSVGYQIRVLLCFFTSWICTCT